MDATLTLWLSSKQDLGQLRQIYALGKDPVRREAKQGGVKIGIEQMAATWGVGDKRRITTVESGKIGGKCG